MWTDTQRVEKEMGPATLIRKVGIVQENGVEELARIIVTDEEEKTKVTAC